MQDKQTAILLFIRDVRDEGRVKQLFGYNQAKNLDFFQALNDKARQTVKTTGLPFYVWSGELQKGATFAERYENAIQTIFDKGYARVIAIGNDSPELSAETLLRIEGELDEHELVYGETRNGGIFSLGLTKEGFRRFEFDKMPWQTESLIKEFEILSRINNNILKLDSVFAEFNSPRNVRDFLMRISGNPNDKKVYGKIFQLYFDRKVPKQKNSEKIVDFFSSEIVLRGPPKMTLLKS